MSLATLAQGAGDNEAALVLDPDAVQLGPAAPLVSAEVVCPFVVARDDAKLEVAAAQHAYETGRVACDKVDHGASQTDADEEAEAGLAAG